MRLDTHVHTSPGSRCSVLSIAEYLAAAEAVAASVICVTNHGDMSDFDELVRLAPARLTVIPGVEISAEEGDFLIYSTDFDYLRALTAVQPLPEPEEQPEDCAVVWAHPFAGSPGGRKMGEEYLAQVAAKVDGIEVYNGNWPDDEASLLARRLAASHGLAELGGSDTHHSGQFFRCWTEVTAEVTGTGELIEAIRERRTKACRA